MFCRGQTSRVFPLSVSAPSQSTQGIRTRVPLVRNSEVGALTKWLASRLPVDVHSERFYACRHPFTCRHLCIRACKNADSSARKGPFTTHPACTAARNAIPTPRHRLLKAMKPQEGGGGGGGAKQGWVLNVLVWVAGG
jgi:hypothetical protein